MIGWIFTGLLIVAAAFLAGFIVGSEYEYRFWQQTTRFGAGGRRDQPL